MFRTLHSKLLFYFLFISLSGIIIVTFAIHFGFLGSFNHYLEQKRVDQIEIVLSSLEEEYRMYGQVSGETITNTIHHQAMTENIYYQFFDLNERLVFDSTFMGQMMGRMRRNQMSGNSIDLSSKEIKIIPVAFNGEELGELHVYYPIEFVDLDSDFLKQFYSYLIGAVIFIVVLSLVISLIVSKKITSGLRQVIKATNELKRHNDGIKLESNGHVKEVQQLVDSFNELSHSLNTQKQLRKQFTNDLAHELRTPLATLQSQLEAFIDGIWEPTSERLKQGHDELMRLVRLVDDLEHLLAAENPQIQLHLTEINGGELLSSIYELCRTTFERKDIQFLLEVAEPNLAFIGDLDRMNQILTNVINNALKYTGESGKVTISTYKKDDNIIFKVEDTGQGISKEDLPHIFERFYRGEKSRDRRTGGVGIGLSIVKALVKAQNGQIKIISNVEEGTTVYIIFKSSNNSGSY